MKWWEKTVEYMFVMSVFCKQGQQNQQSLFLAPLDGKQEQAGDAIFSSDNSWILIEFKKDFEAICSERGKFDIESYSKAKKALSKSSGHHYIIFGQEKSNHSEGLELVACPYFSENGGFVLDLDKILKSGKKFSEFKSYVEQYIQFKKSSKNDTGTGTSSGTSTGMTIEDFALVAGVNKEGKIVTCLSLSEFQRELELKHKDIQHEERSL